VNNSRLVLGEIFGVFIGVPDTQDMQIVNHRTILTDTEPKNTALRVCSTEDLQQTSSSRRVSVLDASVVTTIVTNNSVVRQSRDIRTIKVYRILRRLRVSKALGFTVRQNQQMSLLNTLLTLPLAKILTHNHESIVQRSATQTKEGRRSRTEVVVTLRFPVVGNTIEELTLTLEVFVVTFARQQVDQFETLIQPELTSIAGLRIRKIFPISIRFETEEAILLVISDERVHIEGDTNLLTELSKVDDLTDSLKDLLCHRTRPIK
jgi:hypothetical protein